MRATASSNVECRWRSSPTSPSALGGTPVVSDASFAVLAPGLAKLTGSDGTAWEQLTRVLAGLKNGAYSDGTLPGEERFPARDTA